MKSDRRWWNDGRWERACVEFERIHGRAVARPQFTFCVNVPGDGSTPQVPTGPLSPAEREFVRRLIDLELEAWEKGRR